MLWQYYHKVWFIMGFGWISLYLVRMGIAPILDVIIEEFHISHAVAGSLFSVVFYSYCLMQLPSGYLGDRFGRRRILIIGTFFWFLLSLASTMVKTFSMLVLVRFLIGIAHGTYFGNDRSIVIAFTPKEKMGRGQGISLVGLGLGFFLSVFFGGMITEYFQNWRLVFVFFSIPSLITSILIFKYIKEPPRRPSGLMFKETLIISRKIFIDRNLWLMYLLGFIILFGYWMIATWMPSIYREIGIESITKSSLLSGILGLIGVPGLIISGLLSDQIAQKGYGRKGYIFLIIFLLTLLMLGIGYAIENKASSFLIASLFFCAAFVIFGSWPPYYALLSEMVTQEIVGTTFGMANFIGILSACVAPSVSGWIKDVTGSFSGGIYLSGILLAIGMFLILLVRTSSYGENA